MLHCGVRESQFFCMSCKGILLLQLGRNKKKVLIVNGVREMIFRISFFFNILQERIFACVRNTFSGS